MEKTVCYKCSTGQLETDVHRAFAWELERALNNNNDDNFNGVISFSEALFLLKNKNLIKTIFNEYEQTMTKEAIDEYKRF